MAMTGVKLHGRMLCAGAGLLSFMAITQPAYAAELFCEGKVDRVLTYNNGVVSIQGTWRNSFTHVCGLNTSLYGVPTQSCWAWFAQLNQAVTEGFTVRIWYGNQPDSTTCANLPTYGSSLAPQYVLVIKTP